MATRIIMIILIAFLLISPVSAKFICGEISTPQEISPSWYEVTASLSSNENYFSTCLVSPSNNRYCCDLDIIKDLWGYEWESGDVFKIKITDISSGYFAPEKTITLTGEGYDIAPNLNLQKAIEIINPETTLTISEKTFPLKTKISSDCFNTKISQENMNLGKNKISINTICNGQNFSTEKTFFIIKDITFQKTYIEFEGTSSSPKIKESKTGKINLVGTLSSPVEEVELKEYVPKSWEVLEISANGNIQSSNSEYNVITWKVTGDNFNFNYKVKSPEVGLIPEHFSFKTIIDKHELDDASIQVYQLIPVPLKIKSSEINIYSPEKFSKVSQSLPLVFTNDILSSALYSKTQMENEAMNFIESKYDGKLDKNFKLIKYYKIQTTLSPEERGKIMFEYETNKTFLEKNNYKNIGFYELKDKKFLRIAGDTISSNEETIKYRFESDLPLDEIFILAEKNSTSIWNKIFNFLSRIKFW